MGLRKKCFNDRGNFVIREVGDWSTTSTSFGSLRMVGSHVRSTCKGEDLDKKGGTGFVKVLTLVKLSGGVALKDEL